jgi:hypothetical protein
METHPKFHFTQKLWTLSISKRMFFYASQGNLGKNSLLEIAKRREWICSIGVC